MHSRKISPPAPGSVVGTVHSQECLRIAAALKPVAVDFLELRLDALPGEPEATLRALPQLKFPLIITVRHALEGGKKQISVTDRRKLYNKFMPHGAFIDVELRTARSMRDTIEAARKKGIGIILSYHDFQRTPSLRRLNEKSRMAFKSGASIFKVAAAINQPRDLLPLLAFLTQRSPLPLSVMGIGGLGKASRLLFALSGSVLNYGYLGRAHVPGQWPAELLKQRISELR